VDKIKLFTTNKSTISKSIIENNFDYTGSNYDTLQHNNKLTYSNQTTNLVIDKYGILIKTNPTNYLLKTNLHQIDRKQLITFTGMFEDEYKINTNSLQLTGFDYNLDITTNYEPKSYLTTVRTLPKYRQIIHPYNEGITFVNNCKGFVFYDKIKQHTRDKNPLPIEYSNINLLRLELAVKGKMKQTKNLANINTLKDLTTPLNYSCAIDEFENIYNKIHKQPILKFENMILPTPQIMNTNDFALIYYINEIGMQTYLNQLQQEKDMNVLTYRQLKTRKDKALQLWETYSNIDTNTNDLLSEMESKVKNKIFELRANALLQ
jgi:hypothetical protein